MAAAVAAALALASALGASVREAILVAVHRPETIQLVMLACTRHPFPVGPAHAPEALALWSAALVAAPPARAPAQTPCAVPGGGWGL